VLYVLRGGCWQAGRLTVHCGGCSRLQSDEAAPADLAELIAGTEAVGTAAARGEEPELTEEELERARGIVSVESEPGNVWIVKPSHLSKGQGNVAIETSDISQLVLRDVDV